MKVDKHSLEPLESYTVSADDRHMSNEDFEVAEQFDFNSV